MVSVTLAFVVPGGYKRPKSLDPQDRVELDLVSEVEFHRRVDLYIEPDAFGRNVDNVSARTAEDFDDGPHEPKRRLARLECPFWARYHDRGLCANLAPRKKRCFLQGGGDAAVELADDRRSAHGKP